MADAAAGAPATATETASDAGTDPTVTATPPRPRRVLSGNWSGTAEQASQGERAPAVATVVVDDNDVDNNSGQQRQSLQRTATVRSNEPQLRSSAATDMMLQSVESVFRMDFGGQQHLDI